MKAPIFLSASVPIREPFASNCDVIAIRESILALVAVAVRERELVFGGHPAISPLIEHAARSLGAIHNVHIYQSRWFERRGIIPEVAYKFENFHWTEVPSGSDEMNDSLTAMRTEMIKSRKFCAGIFIGGMEGIFEERDIFKREHAGSPLIALASTGGAARDVFESERASWGEAIGQELETERRYRRLLRKLIPSE